MRLNFSNATPEKIREGVCRLADACMAVNLPQAGKL